MYLIIITLFLVQEYLIVGTMPTKIQVLLVRKKYTTEFSSAVPECMLGSY